MPVTINTALLIAAPMLQDAFVDKTGVPMAGGVVTCYQDNSRTTLKNWFYQSGTPGNYTYIALPNPLTLSAAGTIADINGVDTIPFFYPYSELDDTVVQKYYITIVNASQTNQLTRANFPYNILENANVQTVADFNNLIINGGFWRNIAPNIVNSTPYKSVTLTVNDVVSPSQHDGFSMPDIQFIKNNTSGTDKATFTPFPLSSTPPVSANGVTYVSTEYYLNHNCTAQGTGETQKCYQFPISLHVNTLANYQYTVSIQAQNVGGTGTGQNVISLYILQFTGTGTSSPAPFLIAQRSITLNTQWQTYTLTEIFPSTQGLTLGNGGDDALYLQVQMPLNLTCSINFTKPSLYLTNNVIPSNDFQTYDQVDAIINSPRTGDIRTSLNHFYPYGWVPMNDGTIGSGATSAYATTRGSVDTWPLFNLVWTAFQVFSTGTSSSGTNPIAPMYNSSHTQVGYGAVASSTAISDWNAGNVISLSPMMGKVILGAVPVETLLPAYSTTFAGSGTTITPANSMNLYNGMPVYFGGVSTLSVSTVYYIGNYSGTTFQVFLSFANALTQTSPQTVDATGIIYTSYRGLNEGEYAHTQLTSELASHTHPPLSGTGFWDNTGAGTNAPGAGSSMISASTTGITGSSTPFNITQPGVYYNMFIKL